MIYDYYCTNCGHRMKGREIAFDLAQTLDLQSGEGDGMNVFIKFSSDDLRELAKQNGVSVENEKKVRLEISLADLLNYISQDFKFKEREEFVNLTYDEFVEGTMLTNLLFSGKASDSSQTREVIENDVRRFLDAITAKLKSREADPFNAENHGDEDWNQNTSNYFMHFWVEPIFFAGTEDIYTIHYSGEENPSNLSPFKYGGKEIRGYCPKCNKPIMAEAGVLKHYLVGFLGAQSAGKTTLFASMINDLLASPQKLRQLGIQFPTVLSDEKYDKVRQALEDNKHGWAVRKTDAQAINESFNASMLIEASEGQKGIITFVDIAGELCYNAKIQAVDFEAFSKFPLITDCDLYMLCTCVSQKGYGEADQESAAIDNTALLKITEGIYKHRRDQIKVPPMCLVVTKVDMAEQAVKAGVQNDNNPFQKWNIKKSKNKDREKNQEKRIYNLQDQVDVLKDLYTQCGNEDILKSMEWCSYTCENYKNTTYVSLISCSALGMPGRRYDAEKDDYEKDGDRYKPVRLDVVWDWILRNLGLTPAINGYFLPYVPSYGEGYQITKNDMEYRVPTVLEISEERKRTETVYQMYLNPSELDQELTLFWLKKEDQSSITKLRKKVWNKLANSEGDHEKLVLNYLKKYEK